MGRTVTTFSVALTEEQTRLKEFRRALRAEDQRRFDELFEFARRNVQAAVQGSSPDPMEPLFLLMLIELLNRIETLEAHLDGSRRRESPTIFD